MYNMYVNYSVKLYLYLYESRISVKTLIPLKIGFSYINQSKSKKPKYINKIFKN